MPVISLYVCFFMRIKLLLEKQNIPRLTFPFQAANQESYEGQGEYGGDFGGGEPPFDDVLGALHQKALNATGSVTLFEVFASNTNLAFLHKIDIKGS